MNNPLADTHIALRINIFDQTQQVLVRSHLTVELLIADILREFALELDLNRKYILIAGGRQLDAETVIGEAGLQPDQELVFGYYEPVRAMSAVFTTPGIEQPSAAPPPAATKPSLLREVDSGRTFPLRKPVTVIGRASSASPQDEGVDVDLQSFAEGKSVSRSHARVVSEGGRHHIEPVREDRPIYVNDEQVAFGKKQALKAGDVIALGRMRLIYETM